MRGANLPGASGGRNFSPTRSFPPLSRSIVLTIVPFWTVLRRPRRLKPSHPCQRLVPRNHVRVRVWEDGSHLSCFFRHNFAHQLQRGVGLEFWLTTGQ